MSKNKCRNQRRRNRKGFLTIEWIALVTVLCVGIIGALGVVRNSLILEFNELTDSICETDVLDEVTTPLPDGDGDGDGDGNGNGNGNGP